LQAVISSGSAPAPNGNTCYVLYLPAGVQIDTTLPYDAYHAPFPALGQGLGDAWAVVSHGTPYVGGETQLEQVTRVASHEIFESASDPSYDTYTLPTAPTPPWLGSVWDVFQVPGPIEAGDLCEGSRVLEGGWEYQRIFSNAAASAGGDPCVPVPCEPYFNTSVANDWYSVGTTGKVSIPITGWSTAATSDWLVIAQVVQASSGFSALLDAPPFTPESSLASKPPCYGAGMNNGATATLELTAPAGVASGDYAVVMIESFRDLGTSSSCESEGVNCCPALTDDQFHFWLVGVYVQ
jgi:hypothetical protein